MTKTKKRSHFGLYAIAGIFFTALAAYTVYWFYVADEIRTGVDDWIADQRRAGLDVTFSDMTLKGYPYRFSLHVTDPVIRDPGAGVGWSGDELQLVAMAWNLNRILGRSPGENRLDGLDEGPVTAMADGKSLASFTFREGLLDEISISLSDVQFNTSTDLTAAVKQTSLHLRPMPERPDNLQLTFTSGGVSLSEPLSELDWLGQDLKSGLVLAEITEAAAALKLPGDPVKTWRQRSGLFDLRRMEIEWGPLDLGAKGQVGLDPSGTPEGTVYLRLERADDLRESLDRVGLLDDGTRAAIGSIELMSRDNGFAPIELKQRSVRVGGVRVADLDPVVR